MPLVTDLLQPDRLPFVPATTQTAGGNTGAFSVAQFRELLVFLQVSAASGTGQQLNVFLDASPDGGATWVQAGQIGAADITTSGSFLVTFTPGGSAGGTVISTGFGDTVRVRWSVAGTTPSFTFSVTAIGK